MIPLSRGAVRTFLAVARRATARRGGPDAYVRIAAGAGAVTLTAHAGRVVVGRRVPAATEARAEFVVALDDLQRIDGRTDGPVTVEPTGPQALAARWQDGAGTQEANLPVILGSPLTWRAEPKKLTLLSPAFPAALHEAGRTAAREAPGRYATDQIQIRGKAGQVVATDGKQALTIGGFSFPFPDDLLVPAVPLFGSQDLAREAAVSVGLSGDRLFLVVGPWRVGLRVDRRGRFPDVAGVTPRAVGTRVTFADADADNLIAELPRLPGRGPDPRPVTLDVAAARVAVRARDEEGKEAAEVRLRASTSTGPPVRLVLNRAHLGRALALGCRDLTVTRPDKPVAIRGPDRTYLTVPLDPADAVPPTDADRVARALARPSPDPDHEPVRRTPMATRDRPPPDRPPPDRHGRPAQADGPPEHTGHTTDAQENPDPLAEADALKAALAEAAGRAARLVAALKSYRRERQTLRTAWSSLRALNLGP